MTYKHNKNHGDNSTHTIEIFTVVDVACTVHEYEHDPAARLFSEETVEKLGIDPIQALETLMVHLEPAGEFIVSCVPAWARLSMRLVAKAASAESAAMADPAVAQRRTSHVMGSINPPGQTTSHRVFIGSVCLDYETMVISSGRRGPSVELSPLNLVELTDAEITDLAQI